MIERYFNLAKTASAFSDYKGVHIVGGFLGFLITMIVVVVNMQRNSNYQNKKSKSCFSKSVKCSMLSKTTSISFTKLS